LGGFALRYVGAIRSDSDSRRYLDLGCGNGTITEVVAPGFDETVGVDVEPDRLAEFRSHVAGRPNFRVLQMSGDKLSFPDAAFSFVTCFEVLEHVPDVEATVREIIRVCRPGGVVVVSTPHVWFPLETHGIYVGKREHWGKIPFLPYLRPLHRKYALARVFSSSEMDRLFLAGDMELLATSYAPPQFERAAAKEGTWESRVAFLRYILDRCERVPVLRALTGISMLKAYRKRFPNSMAA
jgi:SAM-dependent methyltransferase